MVVVGFSGASDSVPAALGCAGGGPAREHLTVLSAIWRPRCAHRAGRRPGHGRAGGGAAAAEQALAEARATVADVEGLTMEGKVVFGSPAATLVDASADADLVVVGNRGRSEARGRCARVRRVQRHFARPVPRRRRPWRRDPEPSPRGARSSSGSTAPTPGAGRWSSPASTAARAKAPLVLLHAWEPDAGALAAGVDAWSAVVTEEGEDARRRTPAEQEASAVTADLTARYPGLTVTTQAISQKPSRPWQPPARTQPWSSSAPRGQLRRAAARLGQPRRHP